MKFSLSIDALSKENSFLKLITKLMFALVFVLVLQIIFLYNRDPLLIRSSTRGLELIQPVSFVKSELDIKSAAALMLKARFNSEVVAPNLFLSDRQKLLRENEQKELKSRNMTQVIVVRAIEISKDQAFVEIDRVIAVGDLRSALKTKLKIAFDESEPNELNPYGLVLSLAEAQNTEANSSGVKK